MFGKWSFLKEKIQKSHKMMKNNKKNKRYYLVELHSKTGVWKIWSQFRVKNLRLHDCITRLRSRTWSISIKTIQRILNDFSCMQPEYSSSHTHTTPLPSWKTLGKLIEALEDIFLFCFFLSCLALLSSHSTVGWWCHSSPVLSFDVLCWNLDNGISLGFAITLMFGLNNLANNLK